MKTTEQHLEDLHFEHKVWQSEANFYRDELKIYKEQIDNVLQRDTSSDTKAEVKRIEDQFQNANGELESLHQEIVAHEHNLVIIEKNDFEGSEGENTQKHAEMRRKFHDFKDKYIKLKNEFRSLLKDLI